MLSSPVAISNRMLPTSNSSEARSSACTGERTGGHANSLGITDHSLASTTGTSTIPSPTCSPCVSWKSQDGRVGQSNGGSCSMPTSPGSPWPGPYATRSSSPVTTSTGIPASSTTANTEVNQGPRSGLRKRMPGTLGPLTCSDARQRGSVSDS
jgi:hypothetical protein